MPVGFPRALDASLGSGAWSNRQTLDSWTKWLENVYNKQISSGSRNMDERGEINSVAWSGKSHPHPKLSCPNAARRRAMIRGGVAVGLLTLATGSVLLQVAGYPFGPGVQTVLAILGVAAGAAMGAREPV